MTDSRDFLTRTEQEARVLRNSRMIPDGPIDLALMDAVIADARAYLRETGLSRSALAAAIRTSDTYISNIFNPESRDAVPAKTRDKLIRDINAWMESHARGTEIRRPDNYVECSIGARLIRSCEYAMQIGCIVVADGPSGVGKSTVIQMILSGGVPSIPGAVGIEIDDDSRTPSGLRMALWQAARGRVKKKVRPLLADLIERLRGGSLLIIDQAHLLRSATFDTLQALHNKSKIPIVLVGTKEIQERTVDDGDPLFGQFSSRIGYRCNLLPDVAEDDGGKRVKYPQWVTFAQLRRMLDTGKIRITDDALRMLLDEALTSAGKLRRCKYIVTIAAAAARAEGAETITVEHVINAGCTVTNKPRRVMRRVGDEAETGKAVTA